MDWNAYQDAWNRHDGEAVAAFFTDDGVYADRAIGAEHHGKEAIRQFLRTADAEFSSDFQIIQRDLFTTEDRYAMVWDMAGTHDGSGPASTIPPTGKKFSIRGASVGRLEGDKIKENTDYYNMIEFLSQVGLVPTSVDSLPQR